LQRKGVFVFFFFFVPSLLELGSKWQKLTVFVNEQERTSTPRNKIINSAQKYTVCTGKGCTVRNGLFLTTKSFFTTKYTKGSKAFLPRKTRKARKLFYHERQVRFYRVKLVLKDKKEFFVYFRVFRGSKFKDTKGTKVYKQSSRLYKIRKNFSCIFVFFVVQNLKVRKARKLF